MRDFTLIGGFCFIGLSLGAGAIGMLFKIMHWPGFNVQFIVSTVLAIIGIILISIYMVKYK